MVSIFLFRFLKYKPVKPDSVIDGRAMDIKNKMLVNLSLQMGCRFLFCHRPSNVEVE